jgi:hypothetical protein
MLIEILTYCIACDICGRHTANHPNIDAAERNAKAMVLNEFVGTTTDGQREVTHFCTKCLEKFVKRRIANAHIVDSGEDRTRT